MKFNVCVFVARFLCMSLHKEVCFFSMRHFNFSTLIGMMVFVSNHRPSKYIQRIGNFIERLQYDKIWFGFSVGKQFHILCLTKAENRWCSARDIFNMIRILMGNSWKPFISKTTMKSVCNMNITCHKICDENSIHDTYTQHKNAYIEICEYFQSTDNQNRNKVNELCNFALWKSQNMQKFGKIQ